MTDAASLSCVQYGHRLRHTKVIKNDTSCSSLGTQTYRGELGLVDPASGQDNVTGCGYHVKCLGYDASVRQHYKSEH